MNRNRLSILCFFIAIGLLFGDIQLDDNTPPWKYPFLQPGEIDINIRTEKDTYYKGEIISLEIEMCNLTDRRIAVNDIHFDYMRYFGVDVTSQHRPPKNIKHKNDDGMEAEIFKQKDTEEQAKPLPVPRSLQGKREAAWLSFRSYMIPPHGKLKFRIPLSQNFDFSTAEYDRVYTVSIDCDLLRWNTRNNGMPRKQLVIKKNCKFMLKGEVITSISRLTAENMIETFGVGKTIDILYDEANVLFSRFNKENEEEWRKSDDYARFKRILATLCWASDIHYYDKNIDYLDEQNLMFLDDFAKLLQRCRARRLRMLYEEAEKLLSSLEKIDDNKLKESEEYSKFKIAFELLCQKSGVGWEKNSLEYLEKDNLLDCDAIYDLFNNYYLKLIEVIPFFKNP